MPRYYFQLIDQGKIYHDSEGVDCPDDEAARHEAGIALTEVARDVLALDGLLHEFEIIVLDEGGGTVWRTSLDFEAVPGDAHQSSKVTEGRL